MTEYPGLAVLRDNLNSFLTPTRTKSKKTEPRDSQRQRVYKAETAAFKGAEVAFKTPKEIERWLNKQLRRKVIQRRYATQTFRKIVCDGKRGTRGNAHAQGSTLYFQRDGMKVWIVLHEAAHAIIFRKHGYKVAAHGREWCMVYLDLVHFIMGKDKADALKASFRAHKVRYKPKRKVDQTPTAIAA